MKQIISYKEFLNESKSAIITEANQEEQIKKEVISKLSDFFGCAPGNLSKFNFDGKDNIKELTKALRSTNDAGTEQYYRVAIQMAKRDLGIHESEEVTEAFNNYGWFLRLPKKVIANELRSATSNLTKYFNNASAGQDLQQDVLEDIISELENVKNQLKKFSKGEKPTGVYESEDLNEAKKKITIKFTKSNQPEVSSYVFSRLENDKLVDTGKNGPDYMDLKFDAKHYDKVIDTLRRCDAIDSIKESEEFELNEAVSTPEELASFIQKEEKHFAAFLKPKRISASVNGDIVTIKPGSGSFTITVDYAKSTIDTTGKPEWPESTSYVELMEYIKITKFKLNESEEVNEGRTKSDLEDSLKTLEDKLRKYKGVRQNSIHPFDPQKKVSDYVAYLETSIKYVKAEMEGLKESLNEKMDTKYWADYNDQNSPQSTPEFAEKSTDFEDTFLDAVEEWNSEADGAENQIKGASLKKIEKMAMEFFKIEKWISVNVIQAMIMQES
jgi:hypothetical protein